jgi:hypothetical protein
LPIVFPPIFGQRKYFFFEFGGWEII